MSRWSASKQWDRKEAERIAEIYKLGTILRVHLSPYAYSLVTLFIAWVILSLLFSLFLLTDTPFILFITIEATIFILFSFITIYYHHLLKHRRKTCLYQCTDGIIYVHKGQVDVWQWDQVEEVRATFRMFSGRNGMTIQMDHYYIHLDDGQEPDGDWIGFNTDLRFTLEDRLVQRLQPGLAHQFNRGQTITFGQVNLNKQGISLHSSQRTLPWSELGHINIGIGALLITRIIASGKEENWETIFTSGMPNLCVFIALLRSIVGTKVIEYTWPH